MTALCAVIRRVEWSVVVLGDDWGKGHDLECPFYQWEAK